MYRVDVLASTMAYRDSGEGLPVVFLHGNPTSSHLWRHVMPQVPGVRCLAPDLIGMGASGKPAIRYDFADHARYLEAWLDRMGLGEVVLVGHDWGGALAFDWAARHPGRTRGIAFFETIVRPMSWDDLGSQTQELFRSFRTPGVGEKLVLDENVFIEAALPNLVLDGLAAEDLDVYRRPYPTPESRIPLLQWPRQMPLDGEPTEVSDRVRAYDNWLATSKDVPKLLITFDDGPGRMMTADVVDWCTSTIAGLTVVPGGRAGHHAPEDQPLRIGAALHDWLTERVLVGQAITGAARRGTGA
jgi:haloalkane dehalogenase